LSPLNEFDVASQTSVPLVLFLFVAGTVALWFALGHWLKDDAARLFKVRAVAVGFALLASVLLLGYGARTARVRGMNISVRSAFSSTFRQYTVGDIESYSVDFIKARRSSGGTNLLTLRFRDGTTAELTDSMKNYDQLLLFLSEHHVTER